MSRASLFNPFQVSPPWSVLPPSQHRFTGRADRDGLRYIGPLSDTCPSASGSASFRANIHRVFIVRKLEIHRYLDGVLTMFGMINSNIADRFVADRTVDSQSCIPNLFLIGAPKCGTTSLFDYLDRYEEISGGIHKEPHFFCDDMESMRTARSMDQYLGFYGSNRRRGKYLIDASTCYIYSQTAVANIIQFQPDAKVILILRNPIDLVRSLHDHFRFRQLEPVEDLSTAWNLGPIETRIPSFARRAPNPGQLSYKRAGSLGKDLELMMETVPERNRLVLFFDHLTQNRNAVLQQVMEFLDVPFDESLVLGKRNQAKHPRFPRINRLLFYPPKPLQPIKPRIKALLSDERIRRLDLLARINGTLPTKQRISTSLWTEMRDYFAEDVRLVARLTGRNLDHWQAGPI